MRFGLFQDVPMLLGNLKGLFEVFPRLVMLLPELIHQADTKVGFADASGILYGFLKGQRLLLYGEGFLIALLLCAEGQRATREDSHGRRSAMGLAEQTQGIRQTLLVLRRFGNLLCLVEGRKQESRVVPVQQMVNGEDLSRQQQELEAVPWCDLVCFYQVYRRTEHVEGVL